MKRKQKQGFTLIEILIVVAIIAILASVVLVGLGPTQRAGRDARRISDLRSVQNGLELFYNKCGYYPGTISSGACSVSNPGDWTGVGTALSGVGITNLPNDPNTNATYGYAVLNSNSGYALGAALEDSSNAAFNNYTAPIASGTVTWIKNSAPSIYPNTDCIGAPTGLSTGKTYCVSL